MEFLFPGFLYALGLLAIPIIIHLFNFRRYKTVYFSNTKLLQDIRQQTKAKSRLKHLLALLSRLLVITCLVLAFAQPFLPLSDSQMSVESNFVSVYVDNSFSMEGESENGIGLERAKTMALGICDAYNPKTRFLLLTNSLDKKHGHFVSKEKITKYITEIQSDPNTIELKDLLKRQNDLFRENSKEEENTFYIISDFQKNLGKFSEAIPDSNSKYYLLPIKQLKTANLYIDSCWFDNPARVYNNKEELNVRLVNKSDEDIIQVPVNLYINDSLKSMIPVDVPAGNSAIVTLNYLNTAKGLVYGRIEINDYPITYDNNFYFSYHIEESLKILCINQNDNNYFKALFDDDDYFILQNSNLEEINYFDIKKNNTVIFNQLKEISSGMISEIEDFVASGGSFVFIPAIDGNIESYNNLLSNFSGPLLEMADTQKTVIKTINTSSVIFNNAFKITGPNPKLPVLYSYFPMSLNSRSFTEVLMADENNKPCFTQTNYKKGKIFAFNFPFNEKSSDFVTHPLVIPSFFNIVLNSIVTGNLYITIGKDNSVTVNNYSSEDNDKTLSIEQLQSDFSFIPGTSNNGSNIQLFLYDNIKKDGQYRIMDNKKALQPLSANFDRNESDLSFYSGEELSEIIDNLQMNNVTIYEGDAENITSDIIAMEKGITLWKYFIFAALFFLLLEIAILRLLP